MSDRSTSLPEIAITAAAIRCSLGLDRGSVLDAMLGGKVGIDEAPGIEGAFLDEPGRRPHAAQAMPTSAPRSDRAETELNACVTAALAEARLLPGVVEELRGRGLRVETVFGTTLGGMRHLGAAFRTDSDDEYARTLTGTLNRDCLVGTGLQLGGSSISAACASGVSALSLAATSLLLDEADVVVAIAYDPISEFSYAGFDCLRLVAPGPLRPFTADREGMRVGEGYAAFVLERSDDADARGDALAAVSAPAAAPRCRRKASQQGSPPPPSALLPRLRPQRCPRRLGVPPSRRPSRERGSPRRRSAWR